MAGCVLGMGRGRIISVSAANQQQKNLWNWIRRHQVDVDYLDNGKLRIYSPVYQQGCTGVVGTEADDVSNMAQARRVLGY